MLHGALAICDASKKKTKILLPKHKTVQTIKLCAIVNEEMCTPIQCYQHIKIFMT